MFSRLYRTISSTAPLRNQFPIESPKSCVNHGMCFNAGTSKTSKTPVHHQVNVKPSRGLKCSVGVIFLQRQFMRNFCLLQQKENHGFKPTALQPEQQLDVQSPVLSLFKGYTTSKDCTGLVNSTIYQEKKGPCRALANIQRKRNIQTSLPWESLSVAGSTIPHQCANGKTMSDNLSTVKYLVNKNNNSCRLYSTPTDPKDSKDASEDVPLKVKRNSLKP